MLWLRDTIAAHYQALWRILAAEERARASGRLEIADRCKARAEDLWDYIAGMEAGEDV